MEFVGLVLSIKKTPHFVSEAWLLGPRLSDWLRGFRAWSFGYGFRAQGFRVGLFAKRPAPPSPAVQGQSFDSDFGGGSVGFRV